MPKHKSNCQHCGRNVTNMFTFCIPYTTDRVWGCKPCETRAAKERGYKPLTQWEYDMVQGDYAALKVVEGRPPTQWYSPNPADRDVVLNHLRSKLAS